ncbi:MAG: TraR/DksA family transcriptional regulator [Bdellovibrionota bacterium]
MQPQLSRRQEPLAQSTAEIRGQYPEFVRRLDERREEILRRNQEARANLDEQVMGSPGDTVDESTVDTSADYFLKIANTHQAELMEIREALDRMHRGVYGMCEVCENPIALERLRRLPYARNCVDCQASRERHNPLRSMPKL